MKLSTVALTIVQDINAELLDVARKFRYFGDAWRIFIK